LIATIRASRRVATIVTANYDILIECAATQAGLANSARLSANEGVASRNGS
jgi:hypothetical protein